MAEPETVRSAYERVESLLSDVERYVRQTLMPYCRLMNYLFIDRRKTVESLSEKLDGGRLSTWSDIDDLYACTVVVPVANHEEGVIRKLDASFERKRLRSRSDAKKAPDVFRFDGARWYGVLGQDAANERQPGVGEIKFEVQVVTAFEYAWIAVTHDLVYKADNADWRRQRLAAQLKATVEQIEVLISAFESASGAIVESPWPEAEAKSMVIDRCKLLISDGLIPETLHPASWRRFADNLYALVRSYEGNPHRIQERVSELLDIMDRELRAAEPRVLPVSGTLFQYVISIVARPDTRGSLDSFTVVPSQELANFYGVSDLPKQFEFDGTAKVGEQPSD